MTGATARANVGLAQLAAVAAGLVVLSAYASRIHAATGLYGFFALALFVASAAAWAAMVPRDVDETTALWIILGAALAMRIPYLASDPYLSSDLYRYVWDGRVQGHGINPYRYVPAAQELAALRDGAIYPNINRADYAPTIYPPVAQILFFLTASVSESVIAIKACMMFFEALGIACLLDILRRLGQPLSRIAAWAWHPLALWEIAGNAHIDAAMTGTMVFGVWLFVKNRPLRAVLVVTLAALMKPIALLALPVFWKPWDWRMPTVFAVVVGLSYLPYLSVGWKVFGFASGYVAEEGYATGGGFWYPDLLQIITGPLVGIGRVYVLASAIAIGALAIIIGFRSDRSERSAIRALAFLVGLFLVLLTPHYPWYYLVLMPFLVIFPRLVTLWVVTVGALQAHDVYPLYPVIDYGVRQMTFHSVVLLAIFWDVHARNKNGFKLNSGVRLS